ncbi:MAG: LacI family DNA-binding transcriptional regulator [Bacillota bacterium]|nr:LacI family DNA-binding transcriptional regulator [Bacillota bacterium]MDW7677246.1 LacI family DNA-binding transcriptional regulator [Bacillota bacterium]
MTATIKDIARMANCSYATVSRALNNKPGVNKQTRERIINLANQLDYQPNAIARGLVMQRTHTIGLVIPDIVNPFFPEIARGVEDVASDKGYTVFLCNTNWDLKKENDYLEALQEKRVDGIIITPASDLNSHDADGPSYLETINLPIVIFSGQSRTGQHSYIEIDNHRGGFIATKHLIESGYRRIAFIGGRESSHSNSERLKGYRTALSSYHLPVHEDLIVNQDFYSESGFSAMEELLKLPQPPDAVFSGNDIIALGILECLQLHHIRVPDDFGLVGFDNIIFSGYPQIQLTTISQPKYLMGRYAAEMLLSEIEGALTWEIRKTILEPELIIRKTTRKLKFPFNYHPAGKSGGY